MSRAEAKMTQPDSVPFPLPANVMRVLLDRAAKTPDGIAAHFKRDGVWRTYTWKEQVERSRRISNGLLALGVKQGDRVAILSATRVEHAIADAGILGAGGITVPLYQSILAHEVEFILRDSGASHVFVENDQQLAKIREIRGSLPALGKAILFEGTVSEADASWAMTFDELSRSGEAYAASNPGEVDARIAALEAEQTASLLYTSGTTGNPKGVMLTHRNWCYEAVAVERIGVIQEGDSILFFLPLAHSFAKVVQIAAWHTGAETAYTDPNEIVQSAGEIRPSIIPSAPRVFEKVYSTVVANGSSSPGLKGVLFRWAMSLFDEYVEARQAGRSYGGLGWTLAKKLVFSKVAHTLRHERLGGRIRLFVSGSAPLSPKIAWFFDLLELPVLEGYGLTETSAGTSVNRLGKNKIGTVGPPMPGTEFKIAADGEILIRGGGVMKGYYNRPEETAEVLEPDGWFHSGDIGSLDADGYLRITDRKKDIIVTAGGKNVAPQNIENALKTESIVSQSVVYGDKRKYLTALITVQEEYGRKLLEAKGIRVSSYEELTRHPEIHKEVEAAVGRINANLARYESIKKFVIPSRDFTVESGELTPTLKVKRKVTTERYRDMLDALYDEKFD
ncbi:MAG TPA: long-chain fatty acid--CoA ligase [Vulgatibacter sp.]|nr:long-chain fatty acid--CoA ligase [Vulgatibacter sp.]